MTEAAVTYYHEDRRKVTRGGLVIGLLLISLGIIFLLDNFFPGLGFGRIWPVIIVVWGFAVFVSGFLPPFSYRRLLQGVLVGTIGVILLFNTLGITPFGFWVNVIALWPVLLVAVGFAILGSVLDNRFVSALAPVAIIATLIVALVYQNVLFKDRGMAIFTFDHAKAARVKNGTANIDFNVGSFNLGATDKLYDIHAKEFTARKKPSIGFTQSQSSAVLTVKPEDNARVFAGNRKRDWSVLLSKDADWALDVKTGVSKADIDLSKLKVSRLDLDGGVGDITVRLGDRLNRVNANINSGVSQLRIVVPKTVGVRLKVNRGISSSDFRNINLKQAGDEKNVFETPGFDNAAKKVLLDVDIGISSFIVEGD